MLLVQLVGSGLSEIVDVFVLVVGSSSKVKNFLVKNYHLVDL